MGILDQFQNTVDQAKDQLSGIKNTAIPIEIQNLQTTHDNIIETIEKIEKEGLSGQMSVATDRIIHLRTILMGHYGHLQRGGEPDPCPTCKAHPLYQKIKSMYPALNERLAKLESQYLKCAFGYKMADGSIKPPSLDWSEEEWQKTREESQDKIAGCWTQDNSRL